MGLPGGQNISAPAGIPTGGISMVQTIFKNAYAILLIACIALSLIYLVIGALNWITSGGDKTKLEAARKKITWAIIGLIIALLAFFIVSLLGYIFKVDLLKLG